MGAIQDRLAMFLTELNISVQKFERQCDLGQGAASKLTKRSYATTYAKISRGYPQLNVKWLKTGEGEMLNKPSETPISIRQYKNDNSAVFGYVNIAIPKKGQIKIINSEGIVIDGDDEVGELSHKAAELSAKNSEISVLKARLEECYKTIDILNNLLTKQADLKMEATAQSEGK